MRYEANVNQEEADNRNRMPIKHKTNFYKCATPECTNEIMAGEFCGDCLFGPRELRGKYRVRFMDYRHSDEGLVYTYYECSWDKPEDASAAVDEYCADNGLVVLTRYHGGCNPTRTHYTLASNSDPSRNVTVDLICY